MSQTAYTPQPGDVKVCLTTSLGDIVFLLYGDTPRHRDNFLERVKAGDYDGVLFHRVIDNFMIQTGDPSSKNAPKGRMLGDGDSAPEIDAEILFPTHYHHRGAIAAARTGDNVNPKRRSSGSQFYIVTGKKYSPAQLDQMEHRALMARRQETFDRLCAQNRDTIMTLRRNRDQAGLQALQDSLNQETRRLTAADTTYFTPEIREDYTINGGTPHLDGAYTVYGRVLQGMDIVEKIEKAETDANDRPIDDIKIISAKVVE
ncbi:MAG: peptidylprolyl isomerase [Bacteroides sp.]|nr:peptidylprolyl isomerase [Bacteroides sp.]